MHPNKKIENKNLYYLINWKYEKILVGLSSIYGLKNFHNLIFLIMDVVVMFLIWLNGTKVDLDEELEQFEGSFKQDGIRKTCW